MMKVSTYEIKKARCIEKGVCICCGRARPESGRLRCKDCREKYNLSRQKERAKRITAGLCASCGRVLPAGLYRNCPDCRAAYRKAKRDEKERRGERGMDEVRQFQYHNELCNTAAKVLKYKDADHDHAIVAALRTLEEAVRAALAETGKAETGKAETGKAGE
jgi:hypothetical protein